MRLFVLTEEIPYEGGTPVGVYSSEEAAWKAAAAYRAASAWDYPYNQITILDLDAPPKDGEIIKL